MEQKVEASPKELESHIRGLLLGNVKMGGSQAHQDGQQTQRGRGQGRGGFGRGNHRGNHRGNFQQQGHPHAPTGHHVLQQRVTPAARQPGSQQPRQPPRHQGPPASQPGTQAPQILQRPAPVQGQGNTSLPPHRQSTFHQPRPHNNQPQENPMAQVKHLEILAEQEIPKVEMDLAEYQEKEAFRQRLEDVLQRAFDEDYSGDVAMISLVGFGSLASGFAMPGSDMDLAVVAKWKDPSRAEQTGVDRSIPRLLERAVLDAKLGGRLLTRTRVPILKVCEAPTETLYTALLDERKKWDELPEEEQYPADAPVEPSPAPKQLVEIDGQKTTDATHHAEKPAIGDDFPALGAAAAKKKKKTPPKPAPTAEASRTETTVAPAKPQGAALDAGATTNASTKTQQHPQHRNEKNWAREKVLGPLDFPKEGVGIQCDINFENPLGIHNTAMLRCYSMTDTRVRPMVLFVKSWAKRRKINSAYSGTLNSYGWVLMVLHYLVNIAQPPVCPNLQHAIPKPTDVTQLENFFKDSTINGYAVRFWRNEQEIRQAAQSGRLTQNRESVGALLRGFFQYYAGLSPYGNHYGPRRPQFYWTNEVLSLRTLGGIRSKQDKGWVSAKTTITAEKKVTNRYLFAIEDPFELDHNVARTVTHRGIVTIRDEFRRAWRILSAIGKGMQPEGGIFDDVLEDLPPVAPKEEVKKMGMEDLGADKDNDGVQQITEAIGGL